MPSGGLSVLYLGGTGTISAACVARSLAQGHEVYVLNRGQSAIRPLPAGVQLLRGDAHDADSIHTALGDLSPDAVVDFLCYTAADVERAMAIFAGRTGQYVQISTASIYHKPTRTVPAVESTPLHNPYSSYAVGKIAAERALHEAWAERGFPATVVRPAHTYDDARPPLPGYWTEAERIRQGKPVIAPGDGSSLWTLTHAEDFAVGLVGLLGNPRTIGEAFHIASDEALPWDEIYRTLGAALGVEPTILHLPSEFLPLAAPDWRWSNLILGDLRYSTILDNTKIRRFVPDYSPRITWAEGARRLVGWRATHPELSTVDPAVDAVLDRLAEGYYRAADLFRSLAPRPRPDDHPYRTERSVAMAESPDAATAPREVVLAEPWLHLDSVHGEGVVWHAARQRLLFVDLPVGRIWSVDVQDGSATPLDVPGTVGAVHPTVDPDVLVIADSDGIALYRDGAVERLAAPLGDRPDARMNDANVDPAGRYFAGSMAYDQRPGGADLYRLDLDGTLTTAVPAATISNGLDWSPDERLCYFVDSPLRRVDVFDYDRASGEISHRRTFVDTADVPGIPDGLTVDAAGGVWVAFFGGGRICRYTPDGSLDVVVRLPVSQVTSACFGGSDLDELYISTSTEDLSPEQVADQSAAGAVFRVRTGHVGKPGALFAGVR